MKCYRSDGKIFIEMDEERILSAARFAEESYVVTDNDKFLNFLVNQMLDYGDSGDFNAMPKFHRLLDELTTHAVECDQGIEVLQIAGVRKG